MEDHALPELTPNSAAGMVDADLRAFHAEVMSKLSKPTAGTLLVSAGADPSDTIMRFLPLHTPAVTGHEDQPMFFAAACVSRDLILLLHALNKRFSMDLDAALDLLVMTHPMVQKAMENGSVNLAEVDAGGQPRRVVRDVVEVNAGGRAG
jgi:hypothetical protein